VDGPVKLTLKRRRGRPRKKVIERSNLRAAGRYILRNQERGSLAAAYDAPEKFGVIERRLRSKPRALERTGRI
jgi:hypothetical protein